MSKEKGIFEPQEGFASPPKSPFSIDDGAENPFAASGGESKSPFSVQESEPTRRLGTTKDDSPFASGVNKSPFGYEPPSAGFGASPFRELDEPKVVSDSPFATVSEAASEPAAATSPFGSLAPAQTKPEPTPTPTTQSEPVSMNASTSTVSRDSFSVGESDSASIRQLELRAIFGVDRELTESEILQRSRALPGIRNLARVAGSEAGVVESIKRLIGSLGFGDGQVKLYCGSAPIEFVREGSVLLAVQTDGGFAPGVRETLMIVARELGRM